MALKREQFKEYVLDLLADIPGVTARAMFSGYGIYKNGLIFAIIADGALYFKADAETESEFKAHGSEPFRYTMPNGKKTTMSYWLLPEDIMEELPRWVENALAASRRAKKPKPVAKRIKRAPVRSKTRA